MGCVLDESCADGGDVVGSWRVGRVFGGALRSLVNAWDLQLEYARGLHETLLIPVLMYGNETMLWKEKDRSRTRPLKMDNLGDS